MKFKIVIDFVGTMKQKNCFQVYLQVQVTFKKLGL